MGASCKKCNHSVGCGCQLSAKGLCSQCAIEDYNIENPDRAQQSNPSCEYNLAILQIWSNKLTRLVKDNTFGQVGLNGFQINFYLQAIANAINIGSATGNYCTNQGDISPVKDIMIAIGQKLGF